MTIQSFANKKTKKFFLEGEVPRRVGWSGISRIVARKLDMLDYVHSLADLASPPGNSLKRLSGRLEGRFSIRINDQCRIIFRWTKGGPTAVDVCDYH